MTPPTDPPGTDDLLTALLYVRIAPAMLDDLRRVAKLEGRSVSGLVRRWLDHCLVQAMRKHHRAGRL